MSDISIHKLGDKEYGLVTVPKDQRYFELNGTIHQQFLVWNEMTSPGKFKKVAIHLPAGKWELVGKGSELSEVQWREIVESTREKKSSFNRGLGHYQSAGWETFYKNYEHPAPSICIPNTAIESGLSLLKSKNLSPDTTIILIKKP